MPGVDVLVPTADGACPASLHVPEGDGPWPAVVMYPDAGSLRPTFREMGEHLSGLGYVVLVPDVYYRVGSYEPFAMQTIFSDPDERTRLFGMMSQLTADKSISDATAFFDFLAARADVVPGPMGTTGYCMGGRISMIIAGQHPERVGAAASFHGGRLAVEDDPDSPHHRVDHIKAVVYVAAAENDQSFPAEQHDRLAAAFDAAGTRYTLETYPALHGFAVPDNATYDEAAAKRHWDALASLYSGALAH
jgi:carboxymethylenebutenolidase